MPDSKHKISKGNVDVMREELGYLLSLKHGNCMLHSKDVKLLQWFYTAPDWWSMQRGTYARTHKNVLNSLRFFTKAWKVDCFV